MRGATACTTEITAQNSHAQVDSNCVCVNCRLTAAGPCPTLAQTVDRAGSGASKLGCCADFIVTGCLPDFSGAEPWAAFAVAQAQPLVVQLLCPPSKSHIVAIPMLYIHQARAGLMPPAQNQTWLI